MRCRPRSTGNTSLVGALDASGHNIRSRCSSRTSSAAKWTSTSIAAGRSHRRAVRARDARRRVHRIRRHQGRARRRRPPSHAAIRSVGCWQARLVRRTRPVNFSASSCSRRCHSSRAYVAVSIAACTRPRARAPPRRGLRRAGRHGVRAVSSGVVGSPAGRGRPDDRIRHSGGYPDGVLHLSSFSGHPTWRAGFAG